MEGSLGKEREMIVEMSEKDLKKEVRDEDKINVLEKRSYGRGVEIERDEKKIRM